MLREALASMTDSLRPVMVSRIHIDDDCCGPPPSGVKSISLVEFARDYVGNSKPAIIVGLKSNLDFWKHNSNITAAMGNTTCTVSLTPNGRADAITEVRSERSPSLRTPLFMSAAEKKMDLKSFFSSLKRSFDVNRTPKLSTSNTHHRVVQLKHTSEQQSSPVPYIQLQNGSLPLEFQALMPHISPSLSAFGNKVFSTVDGRPAAENLWIGSNQSVTTMHQDWYDNLYMVVRGTKTFTLVPPWEIALLSSYKRRLRCAKYMVDGDGTIVGDVDVESDVGESPDAGYNTWIDADFVDISEEERLVRFPLTSDCHPVTAHIEPGEVLFLPAMWFHAVSQHEDPVEVAEWRSQGCPTESTPCVIAVNYWYDMNCESPLFWIQDFLGKLHP